MTEDRNENKQITDIVPQNEDNTLPEAPSREGRFIRNLFIYKTVNEAALDAGYSPNTAKAYIYTKIKQNKFQEKVRQYAIENDLMALPKIAYIENKVLDHLVENPLDLPKYIHTVKQKKQTAGILGHEMPKPQPPTINIKELRVFMEPFSPDHSPPQDVEDAELIDTDTK